MYNPADLEHEKQMAERLMEFSLTTPSPCAFEVVVTRHGKGSLVVQPFGMHALFKSHRVLHVVPLPKGAQ